MKTSSSSCDPRRSAAPSLEGGDPNDISNPSNKQNLNDMLVYMRTVQAAAFCKTIESLKEILNDTNITFDKDGLRIMTLDGLKTSLINMRMYADNFEEYHCEKELFIGVNMSNLFKLIKSIENNDMLTLFVKRNEEFTLGIIINNTEKNRSTKFNLKLLDLDQTKIEVPSTEFKNVITLPSSDFQRICRDMQNIGDKVLIENYGTHIQLTCKGDFAEQTTTISGINKEVVTPDNDVNDIIKGLFSLKHLCLFTKCTNLCNTVELYLKNDYPLIIKYGIANLGRTHFVLSPSIDDDDS